jgi:hypothetical protein
MASNLSIVTIAAWRGSGVCWGGSETSEVKEPGWGRFKSPPVTVAFVGKLACTTGDGIESPVPLAFEKAVPAG